LVHIQYALKKIKVSELRQPVHPPVVLSASEKVQPVY